MTIGGTPILTTPQKLARIQDKGQVTLPAAMRRTLNLKKGDVVAFEQTRDGVLVKLVEIKESNGSPWLKELYALFAPVRAEAVAKHYSEGEINDAIDRAVSAVRREHV